MKGLSMYHRLRIRMQIITVMIMETTPEKTTPEETTPEETMPAEETTPEEIIPEETTPEETMPEETTPEETTPEETMPAEETIPEETTVAVIPAEEMTVETQKNKLTEYKTIYEGGIGEITEKKSRFIATVRPIETEEDALAFLEEMKKKYWDARHNCYAYSVGTNREFTRCSDDGEPSGTAGRPMLDVILGEEIYNVAVVVTRYFGGVLLGTGGLVRAYSKAVQEGLAASTVILKQKGIVLQITTDYTGIGKIQYIAGERSLPILDSEYTDRVVLKLLVPVQEIGSVENAITEGTNGRAQLEQDGECYYSVIDGEVQTFDH